MFARTFVLALTSLSLAGAPGVGRAQGEEGSEPRDLTALGEYFLLGGGATNFAKDATKSNFDVGGTWDARVGIGNRFYVGAEAAKPRSRKPPSGRR